MNWQLNSLNDLIAFANTYYLYIGAGIVLLMALFFVVIYTKSQSTSVKYDNIEINNTAPIRKHTKATPVNEERVDNVTPRPAPYTISKKQVIEEVPDNGANVMKMFQSFASLISAGIIYMVFIRPAVGGFSIFSAVITYIICSKVWGIILIKRDKY